MSKSENVVNDAPDKLSKDYAVLAETYYQDGTVVNYYTSFPSGTNDWNRSAAVIPAKKPIQRLKYSFSLERITKEKYGLMIFVY